MRKAPKSLGLQCSTIGPNPAAQSDETHVASSVKALMDNVLVPAMVSRWLAKWTGDHGVGFDAVAGNESQRNSEHDFSHESTSSSRRSSMIRAWLLSMHALLPSSSPWADCSGPRWRL